MSRYSLLCRRRLRLLVGAMILGSLLLASTALAGKVTLSAKGLSLGTQAKRERVSIATASSTGTAVITLKPAPASITTIAPVEVSARADDTTKVASGVLYVDGALVTSEIAYPVGHWQGQGCSVYWKVDDDTVGELSSIMALPDGSHEASCSFLNVEGQPSGEQWSFEVASPPSFANPFPQSLVKSASPTIGVTITDNSPAAIVFTMTLDGTDVAATLDAESGVLSYSASGLSEGSHDVTVTATDAGGLSRTKHWSFPLRTQAHMTFSDWTPQDGAVVASLTTPVRVTVDDQYAAIASAVATLNGSALPVSLSFPRGYWDNAGCEASWIVTDTTVGLINAGDEFRDGLNTLTIGVTNSEGFVEETTWSFTMAAPPVLGVPRPAPGSDVATRIVEISAAVADNDAEPEQVEVRVDGAVRPPQVTLGSVSATTPVLKDDTTHTVSVSATDATGLNAQLSWNFRVELLPDMVIGSCTDCHALATHPMNNCTNCHDPARSGHGGGITRPIARCNCHGSGSHGPLEWMQDCTRCHVSRYAPYVPDHPAPLESAHTYDVSAKGSRCTACHNRSLTREHNKYKDSEGQILHCDSCHAATASARVRNAIAAGVTDCYACHDPHDHRPGDIADKPAGDGYTCTDCHDADLVWEHGAKATSSGYGTTFCDDCHEVGQVRGAPFAWGRQCDDPVCHGAASARPMHRSYCLGCHQVGDTDFAPSGVDFAAWSSAVDYATACPKCHLPRFANTHPYHNAGGNCFACHGIGWSQSQLPATPRVVTSAGAFTSAAAASSTPEQLHLIHGRASWPAGVAKPVSHCASCHAIASCDSCHTGMGASVAHASHGSSGSLEATRVTAWSGTVTEGLTGVDESQVTEHTETSSCGALVCHGGGRTGEGAPVNRETNPAAGGITLTGAWKQINGAGYSAGATMMSYTTNSTLTMSFTGTRVALIADTMPDRGIADVYIDGSKVAAVDCYSAATLYQQVVFESNPLASGPHTVMVKVTGAKNTKASAAAIAPDQFKVYNVPVRPTVPVCSNCHPARALRHW